MWSTRSSSSSSISVNPFPAGDPGAVCEQADPRVTLEHGRGGALDRLAFGDVAELVLAAELGRERCEPVLAACHQDEVPAVASEPARERLADPARRARDDRDSAAV